MKRTETTLTTANDANMRRMFGKLWDEYQIYVANTPAKFPKTFEEWLES